MLAATAQDDTVLYRSLGGGVRQLIETSNVFIVPWRKNDWGGGCHKRN